MKCLQVGLEQPHNCDACVNLADNLNLPCHGNLAIAPLPSKLLSMTEFICILREAIVCVGKDWGTVLIIQSTEWMHPERVTKTHPLNFFLHILTHGAAHTSDAQLCHLSNVHTAWILTRVVLFIQQMHVNLSPTRAFCWHGAATAGHSQCKSSLQWLQRTAACEDGHF